MNFNKLENSYLFSLKNKVTIVAGASKGIGLAISKGFKENLFRYFSLLCRHF